jgi:hypothetical protein
VKYVENCEGLLFQRPDDAIVPATTPSPKPISPLPERSCRTSSRSIGCRDRRCADDAIAVSEFTEPMRDLLTEFASGDILSW